MRHLITWLFVCLALVSCEAKEAIEDAIDIADVPRKTIDTSKMGVNAFANDSRFGSIESQFLEVRDTLRLNFVRVLFAWNDGVQSSASAEPEFGFYDSILAGVPDGVDVLIVVTGLPSWMSDSSNWVNDNPRKTFVEDWVRRVAARYGSSEKVVGFEIWNEPNMESDSDNVLLGVSTDAGNYVEMLGFAYSVIKDVAPSKNVVSAATTAINQNYPHSIKYDKDMKDAGAEEFLDIWGVHYYGKQFENVVQDGGVEDFLNSLSKPVWVTESGAAGVNEQLAYVEQVWPFLQERIPGIERFYYYQFTEATASDVTYGLRNLSSNLPVSDLYVYLRDR